jgi:hypothetical protein
VSHCIEETYSVYKERCVRARKGHTCEACRDCIPAGDRYWSVRVVFDGSAETIKRCLRCQRVHAHLRELGRRHDVWPAERLDCGLDYEDEWGPLPEDIARLAFVTGHDLQGEGEAEG